MCMVFNLLWTLVENPEDATKFLLWGDLANGPRRLHWRTRSSISPPSLRHCPVAVATEKKSSGPLLLWFTQDSVPFKRKKNWARRYGWKLWQPVVPNQCPRPHQLCFHPLTAVICQLLLTVSSLKQLWKQVLGPQAASFPSRLQRSHERTSRHFVCQEGRFRLAPAPDWTPSVTGCRAVISLPDGLPRSFLTLVSSPSCVTVVIFTRDTEAEQAWSADMSTWHIFRRRNGARSAISERKTKGECE